MKTLDSNELANVTGGALFSDMRDGATTLGNRWSQNSYNSWGGARNPVAGLPAALSGLFGTVAGGLAGASHTIFGTPLPQK
jgi:bacteriocin-like protein